MGTFLKKEVRLESKQLLNHGNSCLHTDAIDISKSYILMSHRHVFTVTLISTQIMFRVIRVPEKKNILSVVLNFSWCALFYIKSLSSERDADTLTLNFDIWTVTRGIVWSLCS